MNARRGTVVRWLKFNAVGALGIAVQLSLLFALTRGLHAGYLLATAVAVEAAVLHNFLWHERYTWAERVRPSWRHSLARLFRFNLTTGAVSIAGNLALMRVLAGFCHMNYLAANGIAIAVCSLANFLLSEHWVFASENGVTRFSAQPSRNSSLPAAACRLPPPEPAAAPGRPPGSACAAQSILKAGSRRAP